MKWKQSSWVGKSGDAPNKNHCGKFAAVRSQVLCMEIHATNDSRTERSAETAARKSMTTVFPNGTFSQGNAQILPLDINDFP